MQSLASFQPSRAAALSSDASHPGVSPNHVVHFYDDDAAHSASVAAFLLEGWRSGEAAIAIVAEARRAGLSEHLERAVLQPDSHSEGEVVVVVAESMLQAFMRDALPDAERFREQVETLILARGLRKVRVYGEMVDLLWRRGQSAAALRLEVLWNELLERHDVTLLCGYALGNFAREADSQSFVEVCRHHGRVIPTRSDRAQGDGAARELAVLQQRARALESEIAHRRTLEQALRSALDEAERANRAKSEFLAIMSHELRTPLNGIIGYQDLLDHEVGGPITKRQREYLDRIKSGAEQLLTLIDQVLSLSRIEAGKEMITVHPVDVCALARETAALLEPVISRKHLAFYVRTPAQPELCFTDPFKLKQILLNLLSNAAKFTAEGTIELELRVQEERVVIVVRDTGIGIRNADQERIFDPFVQVDATATRRTGGIGLGLPVSRNLARLLGGDLTVQSQPGSGSVFTLQLPKQAPSVLSATT